MRVRGYNERLLIVSVIYTVGCELTLALFMILNCIVIVHLSLHVTSQSVVCVLCSKCACDVC